MLAAATNIAAADFPIHRRLPTATVVRRPTVTIVEPRMYLTPTTFSAVMSSNPPAVLNEVWSGTEQLKSSDGWIDFTKSVGVIGQHLYLSVDDGEAQISYAEVVFDDGASQVVDFNDQFQDPGLFSLVDSLNGQRVDHVRVVAKADSSLSDISLRLAP